MSKKDEALKLRTAAEKVVELCSERPLSLGKWFIDMSEACESLREALAEQPAQQEPVAWMEMVVANLVREGVNKHRARELAQHFYTSPPAQRTWVGLTDEEAKKAFAEHNCDISKDLAGILARAIEAKLKEKNT